MCMRLSYTTLSCRTAQHVQLPISRPPTASNPIIIKAIQHIQLITAIQVQSEESSYMLLYCRQPLAVFIQALNDYCPAYCCQIPCSLGAVVMVFFFFHLSCLPSRFWIMVGDCGFQWNWLHNVNAYIILYPVVGCRYESWLVLDCEWLRSCSNPVLRMLFASWAYFPADALGLGLFQSILDLAHRPLTRTRFYFAEFLRFRGHRKAT